MWVPLFPFLKEDPKGKIMFLFSKRNKTKTSGPWGHGGESAAPIMPWSSLPAVQQRRLVPQDRVPGRAAAPASCHLGWAGFVTSSGSELTPHAGD